jgi:hypothetical protein
MRTVKQSGFLGDYSQLHKGKEGQARLVYFNPAADFKRYTKILFDPITIYAAEKSALAKLPEEDLQACVNYLDAAVRDALSPEYTFVEAAGPDVLRLRIAITEIKGANVAMNTVSTIMPVGLALSSVKKVATGTHSGVGLTSIEMELKDSESGERLAAAVDGRSGKKISGKMDKFDKYAAVNDAFDYWAKRLEQRLSEARLKKSW